MAEHQRPPLRVSIAIIATLVWIASSLLPEFFSRIPPEQGIGAAYMAVLAAVLAFPELDRHRRGRGKDDSDDDS